MSEVIEPVISAKARENIQAVQGYVREAKIKSAVAALGLTPNPMRGVWNEASPQSRRFMCKVVNVVNDGIDIDEHGARVGAGAWSKSWDELSDGTRAVISDCFMRLRGWVRDLDKHRESGVHHG